MLPVPAVTCSLLHTRQLRCVMLLTQGWPPLHSHDCSGTQCSRWTSSSTAAASARQARIGPELFPQGRISALNFMQQPTHVSSRQSPSHARPAMHHGNAHVGRSQVHTCPITKKRIVDAVTAEDGFTYEREALIRWVEEHGTSPETRTPLDVRTLRKAPHVALNTGV